MYKFAFKNLWLRKSRSLFALVGLSVAIIGIIGLISISSGIKYEVTSMFSKMEGVTVMQKGVFDDTQSYLSLDYKKKLEAFQESKIVVPSISGIAVDVEKKGRVIKSAPMGGVITFIGVDVSEASKLPKGSVYNPHITRGRELKSYDTKDVIIGKTVADDYDKTIGSKIYFNGETFQIVGIFEQDSKFFNRMIILPIEEAQKITHRDSDMVGFYYIEPKNPSDSEKLADKINFRYEDEGLEASSGSGFAGEISGIMKSLDLFFYGVSSIALFVGAIGIINTMLMSVLERTKEFGILKAVGWTNTDILKLIIFESIFLGLIGGSIGIILSIILVKFIAPHFLTFTMIITPQLIIMSFLLSLLLGIIGGIYPAWRASKLDPVKAIRFE